MMKVDAYQCDACKQLFIDSTVQQFAEPKGATIHLGISKYSIKGDTNWDFDHLCKTCREKIEHFMRETFGADSDAVDVVEPAPAIIDSDFREVDEEEPF